MASQLEAFNEALGILQQPPLAVPQPNPSTESSRLLNAAWLPTVKVCLEAAEWDFAIKRKALARLGETPAFGYAYYYELPADRARLVYVSETGEEDDPMLPGRYRIEEGKLATDAETVYARWVSYDAVNYPGRWSATFARYVATELAIRCPKLNTSGIELASSERRTAKGQAAGIDAVQNQPRLRRPGTWATANRRRSRGGGSGLPEQG